LKTKGYSTPKQVGRLLQERISMGSKSKTFYETIWDLTEKYYFWYHEIVLSQAWENEILSLQKHLEEL